MKIKNLNNVVNIIILIYISTMVITIVCESIKEIWLYKQYLDNSPMRPQFQTDFLKESIKMIWKNIASKLTEIQAFITGLIVGVVKNTKEE